MKVFFDCEFLEDGQTIDLISIGMVREDGKTLYRVSSEFNEYKALKNAWLRDNVLKDKILMGGERHSRAQIAQDILGLVEGFTPQFWGYYADYDWVALCQLYGPMMALPTGWPMYCRDLKQVIDQTGIRPPEQTGVEHHALADAVWIKEAHDYVRDVYVSDTDKWHFTL